MRDQLWAEAVHRFKAGEPWWLETPELEALATAEQAVRLVVDAWEDSIAEWLGDRTDVSVKEVLEHVFGLAPEPRRACRGDPGRKDLEAPLGFKKHRPRTAEGAREPLLA